MLRLILNQSENLEVNTDKLEIQIKKKMNHLHQSVELFEKYNYIIFFQNSQHIHKCFVQMKKAASILC